MQPSAMDADVDLDSVADSDSVTWSADSFYDPKCPTGAEATAELQVMKHRTTQTRQANRRIIQQPINSAASSAAVTAPQRSSSVINNAAASPATTPLQVQTYFDFNAWGLNIPYRTCQLYDHLHGDTCGDDDDDDDDDDDEAVPVNDQWSPRSWSPRSDCCELLATETDLHLREACAMMRVFDFANNDACA